MSFLLALLLAQAASPALKVVTDEFGECFLYGNNYVQIPAVTCTNYGASANYVTYSDGVGSVPWGSDNATVAAPTIGAINNVAFDGQLNAVDVTFPATSGTSYSMRYLPAVCPAGTLYFSIYAKAVAVVGTFDLCFQTSGSSASCADCVVTSSSSYNRCSALLTSLITGGFWIGNMSRFNGGIARPTINVLVSGAQCEPGMVTPLIHTSGAVGTRAAGCY